MAITAWPAPPPPADLIPSPCPWWVHALVFLFMILLAGAVVLVLLVCSGEQSARREIRRRGKALFARMLFDEQSEIQRERLIDEAGRKPWQVKE